MRRTAVIVLVVATFAFRAAADDALQWNGFALLRASTESDTAALKQEPLSAQLQVGIDWSASPLWKAHVHLLGRSDADDRSRRGTAGVVEAYVEANLHPNEDRLRIRAGSFFLPTSRENVDALWESPYTITSSALNSWLGEELRPIGVDASYFRGRAFGGATLFRGNDTFGALPVARGWSLRDHWTLLGEWIPVDPEYFTSVSAETDHRLGWSARGGWNGPHLLVQLTHIDNRSDGLDYGRLFNWGTRFDIASAEYTHGDWLVAGEAGWGPTFLVVEGERYTNDLYATYVLVSRALPRGRASIRVDAYTNDVTDDRAITLAYFWSPPGKLRVGAEVTATDDDTRAMLEFRYGFSGH